MFLKKVTVYLFLIYIAAANAQIIDSLQPKPISKLKTKTSQTYNFADRNSRTYKNTRFWQVINTFPKDFVDVNKDFVAKDHAYYLGGALLSTAILIPLDQQIIDQSRSFAERQGLSSSNKYGKFGPLTVIPKNIGAGFYLVGNGTTVIVMSAGFLTYGLLKNDFRSKATASELIESLALSGVFVQTIKRISGRESPFIAIQNGNSGGDWNPFPSFAAYAKNTPNYDAIPSGHLTTIMAGLTVVIENYPEYKWIKPVGYAAITGMCFQMLQSEVHWASDYPIAILMGYFIGKTVAKNRFVETKSIDGTIKKYSLNFSASRNLGYNMVGANIKF
jgi:PAP2 superfamily